MKLKSNTKLSSHDHDHDHDETIFHEGKGVDMESLVVLEDVKHSPEKNCSFLHAVINMIGMLIGMYIYIIYIYIYHA